jgi:hypothetical protein
MSENPKKIEKPTQELSSILEQMGTEQLGEYLKANKEELNKGDYKRAFYNYFTEVLETKNLKLKDVYRDSNISEGLAGKIIRMEKHTKKRDYIIRLCVAGHFDLRETNKALKLYGMNELYPKNSRDACFIIAINNRIFDPYEIDEMLEENGLGKLEEPNREE